MRCHTSRSELIGIMGMLLFGLALESVAADYSYYGIGKGICYDQTRGGEPVLKQVLPYAFEFRVVPTNSSTFIGLFRATNQFGSVLPVIAPFKNALSVEAKRASDQAALDSSITNGIFYLKVEFGGATTWSSIELGPGVYPSPPKITNLTAARGVDPTLDFTLEWDEFVDGTANDFIYCEIISGFRSGYHPGDSNALNGKARSLAIPAGTLAAGKAYLGRLFFARVQVTDSNSNPGTAVAAYLFSQTEFWLCTQGADVPLPPALVWTNPRPNSHEVPADMPISIEFNKPMDTSSVSFLSTGFGVGTHTWNSNRTILYLPAAGSGGSTAVRNLVLNPYVRNGGFRDLTGTMLPETGITFSTSPRLMSAVPLQLTNYFWRSDGVFETEVRGTHGANYTLQRSGDLENWTDVLTNAAIGGVTHFADTNAAASQVYRAVMK